MREEYEKKKNFRGDGIYFILFSIIFSATMSPSIAEEVIPPAYPAHSPAG